MKKLIAMLMAAAMVLSLYACGSGDSGDDKSGETAKAETEVKAADFKEKVLFDNDQCTFTVKAIDSSASTYSLSVAMVNKSDLDLTFTLDYATINGWTIGTLWADTVTAGMSGNSSIEFASSDLKAAGISDVQCIELHLRVYDDNDWVNNLVDETYTIYPLGAESFDVTYREKADSDIVLVDTDEYSVIVTGFDPDNVWGYTMTLYLCNKTDKYLMFSTENTAINGTMCDPFWASAVAPHSQEYSDVSWSDSALEESGIDSVSEISFPLSIRDYYDIGDLLNETYTITAQ